jgi:hypothetical protein
VASTAGPALVCAAAGTCFNRRQDREDVCYHTVVSWGMEGDESAVEILAFS